MKPFTLQRLYLNSFKVIGGDIINRFIPTIRSDRHREIDKYIKKGYNVADKTEYIYVDTISISNYKGIHEKLIYEVRLNIHWVNFYIMKFGSRIYLTMNDIYLYLYKFKNDYSINVIDHLRSFNRIGKYSLDENEKKDYEYYMTFDYMSVKYHISQLPECEKYSDTIVLNHIDCPISYADILVLLFLIQGKSNYFETLSNNKYTDGLINMLIALLTCNYNNDILEKKGWQYMIEMKRFKNIKKYDSSNINKKKWYLTEDELDYIMNIES